MTLRSTFTTGGKHIIGLEMVLTENYIAYDGLERKKIIYVLDIIFLRGRFLYVIRTCISRWLVILRCKDLTDLMKHNARN